jgi:hypothetical protein
MRPIIVVLRTSETLGLFCILPLAHSICIPIYLYQYQYIKHHGVVHPLTRRCLCNRNNLLQHLPCCSNQPADPPRAAPPQPNRGTERHHSDVADGGAAAGVRRHRPIQVDLYVSIRGKVYDVTSGCSLYWRRPRARQDVQGRGRRLL